MDFYSSYFEKNAVNRFFESVSQSTTVQLFWSVITYQILLIT